ncbi:unnamed protein product, partial [Polarella glacialis]
MTTLLLQRLRQGHRGLELDIVGISAASAACARASQWTQVLALLQEGRQLRIDPNRIAMDSAMAGVVQSQQWAVSLSLLEEMWMRGPAPDTGIATAAVGLCGSMVSPALA